MLINTAPVGASVPSFAPKVDLSSSYNVVSVASADVNGDGRPDLVIGNNEVDGSVSVLLNTTPNAGATPTFAAPVEFATDKCTTGLTLPDIDADGRPDIVAVDNCTDRVSVLINATPSGATTPMFQSRVDLGTGPVPVLVTSADLNGDARVDLVVAASGNGTDLGGVSVLLGQ